MPTRHKNVRALLRSGQEASELATYFYTCMRSALDLAGLLFWSDQCLELPFIVKSWEKGRGLLQLDTSAAETLTQIQVSASRSWTYRKLSHFHVRAPLGTKVRPRSITGFYLLLKVLQYGRTGMHIFLFQITEAIWKLGNIRCE